VGQKKTAEQMAGERRQKKQARKGGKSRMNRDEGFSFQAIKEDRIARKENRRRELELRQLQQLHTDNVRRLVNQALTRPVVFQPQDIQEDVLNVINDAAKLEPSLVVDVLPNGMRIIGVRKNPVPESKTGGSSDGQARRRS